MAIVNFKDKYSKLIFEGERISKGISPDLQHATFKKLLMLNMVDDVDDLLIPPSNRLEKLHGDRRNFYSIRVNKQWRICFRFEDGDAYDVELVDYH